MGWFTVCIDNQYKYQFDIYVNWLNTCIGKLTQSDVELVYDFEN